MTNDTREMAIAAAERRFAVMWQIFSRSGDPGKPTIDVTVSGCVRGAEPWTHPLMTGCHRPSRTIAATIWTWRSAAVLENSFS